MLETLLWYKHDTLSGMRETHEKYSLFSENSHAVARLPKVDLKLDIVQAKSIFVEGLLNALVSNTYTFEAAAVDVIYSMSQFNKEIKLRGEDILSLLCFITNTRPRRQSLYSGFDNFILRVFLRQPYS